MKSKDLGANSLMAFVKTLRDLIYKGSAFDLVIGAGDSGQAMVWLTHEVYTALCQETPRTMTLPIYRHADDAETILFDNNYFSDALNNEVDLKDIKNILLVDDEVGNGTVVNAIANLIQFASDDSKERNLTIIAENQGYQPPEKIHELKINFIPTKEALIGTYNAISLIVPDELRKEIKNAMEGLVEYPNEKLALNALLGTPIKNFNDGKPILSNDYISGLKNRIIDFEQKQIKFNKELVLFIKNIATNP